MVQMNGSRFVFLYKLICITYLCGYSYLHKTKATFSLFPSLGIKNVRTRLSVIETRLGSYHKFWRRMFVKEDNKSHRNIYALCSNIVQVAIPPFQIKLITKNANCADTLAFCIGNLLNSLLHLVPYTNSVLFK